MVDARSKQVGRGIGWGRAWVPGGTRFVGVALAALAVIAAGVLSAPTVAAKPEYPGQLKTAAAMDCTPACTLCHTDPAGGIENLREAGIWAPLATAATSMPPSDASLMADTDKDTVSDLNELRAGTDPGSAANTLICTPEYGCFARVARGAPRHDDGAAVAAALVAAALALSAARRQRRPS